MWTFVCTDTMSYWYKENHDSNPGLTIYVQSFQFSCRPLSCKISLPRLRYRFYTIYFKIKKPTHSECILIKSILHTLHINYNSFLKKLLTCYVDRGRGCIFWICDIFIKQHWSIIDFNTTFRTSDIFFSFSFICYLVRFSL